VTDGGSRRRSIFTSRLVRSGEGQPQVTEDLRRAILAGDEPPGTLIPIEAVARFFGVSQIPVREALKVLLGEGLVEHVPHIGYSVAKLTFAEFTELYDVREALERQALAHAVGAAGPADHADACRQHELTAAALAAGDERGYHAATRAFHLALMAPAGMQRLVHMYENAWNMTEPARSMSHVATGDRRALHEDHERMLAAYQRGDAAALLAESQTHYAHLRAAVEVIRDDPDTFRPPR
jgi:DNA-binding GntR family transcriptional regulator